MKFINFKLYFCEILKQLIVLFYLEFINVMLSYKYMHESHR